MIFIKKNILLWILFALALTNIELKYVILSTYFTYVLYLFINSLGRSIPIFESLLLIASSQWLIGPSIEYLFPSNHYKYFMYVDENVYFAYALPAVLSLHIGSNFFAFPASAVAIQKQFANLISTNKRLPLLLILSGVLIQMSSSIIGGELGFLAYLLSQVRYIGVLLLLFQNQNRSWLILILTLSIIFTLSVISGFFHEFILWALFLGSYYFILHPPRLLLKVGLVIGTVVFLVIIQSIKQNYRSTAENLSFDQKITLFTNLFINKASVDTKQFIKNSSAQNVRLNQGWIISAIMKNVPKRKPYAEGETIKNALYAALIPRIIDPTKKKAGGREDFMKYTGLYLGEQTSMGMSVLGEFYANFGKWGGIWAIGIYGFFLSFFLRFVFVKSRLKNVAYIVVPILFLQVLKAETDLVTVLNHLIKSTLLFYLVHVLSLLHWENSRLRNL